MATGIELPRRLAPSLLVLCLACGSLACAHRGFQPVEAPAGGAGLAAEGGRQALLRVRYRGLDGRGRVRLTVRALAAGEFFLAAADTFGRQLWSFGGVGGRTLLLDHRSRQVCRFEKEVAVQAIALADLPVSILPRVLLGELPFTLPDAAAVEVETTDAAGRRWTAVLDGDGGPNAWTLWEAERPIVWWQATPNGAILSHRDGAQVLWTVVAEEELDGPLEPIEVPAGYTDGQCDAQELP